MEKLQKTAGKLDVFIHILQVGCMIAAVAALVALVLIGACFLFQLDPKLIGTGYHSLDLGFLELSLTEAVAPDKHVVLGIVAGNVAFTLALALLSRAGLTCVRRLLAPMKEGSPFHGEASACLKKLALLSLVIGAMANVMDLVNQVMTNRFYRLTEVLRSDAITQVSLNFNMDLTYVAVSAMLLLLSYVFHYGQALQQLSDETL